MAYKASGYRSTSDGMPPMLIAGIDPSLAGAICLLDPDQVPDHLTDLPTFVLKRGGTYKRELDPQGLISLLPR